MFKESRIDNGYNRSLDISFVDKGEDILNNSIPECVVPEYYCDQGAIKLIMEKVGLSDAMLNSELCYRDFLCTIYCKGLLGNISIPLIERELIGDEKWERKWKEERKNSE